MTMLHAGGKFDNRTYKISEVFTEWPLVVNALSEFIELEIRRDGKSVPADLRAG